MSVASQTEAWLLENFDKIESGIADFEKTKGTKPWLVVMAATSSQILLLGKQAIDQIPPRLLKHPAMEEVSQRHKAGVYTEADGTPFDVPIICEASTVYRTLVETVKLKRELQAAGAIVLGGSSVTRSSRREPMPSKRRFKQRKRRR